MLGFDIVHVMTKIPDARERCNRLLNYDSSRIEEGMRLYPINGDVCYESAINVKGGIIPD